MSGMNSYKLCKGLPMLDRATSSTPELIAEITSFLKRWEHALACPDLRESEGGAPGFIAEDELERTLASCHRLSGVLELEADNLQDMDEYLQFLYHELRTPLTAAGTALEILREPHDSDAPDSRQQLIDLALRNLKRLEQAATWCEDYLSSRTLDVPEQWMEHNVHQLITGAADVECPHNVFLEFADAVTPCIVCGDDALFHRLVRQVLRALHYEAPGVPVALRVEIHAANAGGPNEMHLTFAYCELGDGPSRIGTVARTRLANVNDPTLAELQRLLEFTVSPRLLSMFDARVELRDDRQQYESVLKMVLPVKPAECFCDG